MTSTPSTAPAESSAPAPAPTDWDRASARARRWALAALVTVAAVVLACFADFVLKGRFNVDELENVDVLWLEDHGAQPYRDFLHTHTPVFAKIIRPAYDRHPGDVASAGAVRAFLLPVMLLSLAFCALLAYEAAGRRAALIVLILIPGSPWMVTSMGEARPDTFGVAVLLAAWLCYARAARKPEPAPLWFLLAGLLYGFGYLFTMKNGMSMIVAAWAFERLHLRRGVPPARRFAWMTAFGLLAAAPYAVVFAGLLRASGGDVRSLETVLTQYANMTDAPIAHKLHAMMIGLFVFSHLIAFLFAGAELRRLRRVREPLDPAPGLAAWLGVAGILNMLVILSLDLGVPHLYVQPALFFSIVAAARLSRAAPRVVVRALLAALVLAQAARVFDQGRPDDRGPQLRELAFVQQHAPPGYPIVDVAVGYSVFRPIIGRAIHYRRGLIKGEHIDEQDVLIMRALMHREVGAVIDNDIISERQPPLLRATLARCYKKSPEVEFAWFPRPGRIPGCGTPRAPATEGGIWNPPRVAPKSPATSNS